MPVNRNWLYNLFLNFEAIDAVIPNMNNKARKNGINKVHQLFIIK
jgi:hypothetical protein